MLRYSFAIAVDIGAPIVLDEATNKKMFGHFARVLVDVDLSGSLREQILVEREGFSFFVGIEYENMSFFCSICQIIGHSIDKCRSQPSFDAKAQEFPKDKKIIHLPRKHVQNYVPKKSENEGPNNGSASQHHLIEEGQNNDQVNQGVNEDQSQLKFYKCSGIHLIIALFNQFGLRNRIGTHWSMCLILFRNILSKGLIMINSI